MVHQSPKQSTRYRYIKLNENGKVDWEGGDNRNVWVVPHVNYTLNDGALEVNLLQLKGFEFAKLSITSGMMLSW